MIKTLKFASVAVALVATAGLARAAKEDPQYDAAKTEAEQATTNIESVVTIAKREADKMGAGTVKLNNTNAGFLAGTMANAIIAKPSGSGPEVNQLNKQDEVAEVAAFIVDGMATATSKFQKTKVAGAATQTVIKQALKLAKKSADFITSTIFRDVAGSVALTIHNSLAVSDKLESKIAKKLIGASKALAGKKNKNAIKQGLQEGFLGDAAANSKYEDGTIDDLAVADPETDKRPA